METLPEIDQPYSPPPPPPPQRSRKGLWIGLGIGAVVLCLCCAVVAVVYIFRQDIPLVSSFFPTPTPVGLSYSNSSAGISLTYPTTWVYDESGDPSYGYAIVFASSQAILDDISNPPSTGAALVVLTQILDISTDLPSSVDTSSMTEILDYIATQAFSNLSNGQNIQDLMVSGLPAASGIYTMANASQPSSAAYMVAVARDTEVILFFGVCPKTDWAQYQPIMESIVNSASIVASQP